MKRIVLALAALVLAAPAAHAADIAGRASFGASGGGMVFLSGDDFSGGGLGRTRFIGQAVFKYNFSQKLAAVVESGWGWNSYETGRSRVDVLMGDALAEESDTLATVIPTTLGLEYRFQAGGTKIWPYLGAGGGVYSMGIKDSFRTWAQAGDNAKRLTWSSPGFYGKVGAEYLFDSAVSINLDFVFHQIFSRNEEPYTFTKVIPIPQEDDFPDELDYWAAKKAYLEAIKFSNSWGLQNTSFAQIRIGVNYYFTLKSQSPVPDSEE